MKEQKIKFYANLNGVSYTDPNEFYAALDEYFNQQGKPCNETASKKKITRPIIYGDDLTYIIPCASELSIGKFALEGVIDDTRAKLEKRMDYYVQQVNAGELSYETIQNIACKAKYEGDIYSDIVSRLVATKNTIESIESTVKNHNIDAISETSSIIAAITNFAIEVQGYYRAMQNIAEDELSKHNDNDDNDTDIAGNITVNSNVNIESNNESRCGCPINNDDENNNAVSTDMIIANLVTNFDTLSADIKDTLLKMFLQRMQ